MATETIDPRYIGLDGWPIRHAIEAMWEGQAAAVAAIHAALPSIANAVSEAAEILADDGRLIYVGAGTSGRIAAQDGAELTPTFNWPPKRTLIILAGGTSALLASVEGAEDDDKEAIRQIDDANISARDVVIGLAASGNTPFTVAAIRRSAESGALTIGVANNADTQLLAACRFPILIPTGSELVAGSTRMKAGTAQKAVLNMISTGIMLQLGRVYDGMMVNMLVANAKLQRRAIDIIMRIAKCPEAVAQQSLDSANQHLKLAIVIAFGHSIEAANALLARYDGRLRPLIAALKPSP